MPPQSQQLLNFVVRLTISSLLQRTAPQHLTSWEVWKWNSDSDPQCQRPECHQISFGRSHDMVPTQNISIAFQQIPLSLWLATTCSASNRLVCECTLIVWQGDEGGHKAKHFCIALVTALPAPRKLRMAVKMHLKCCTSVPFDDRTATFRSVCCLTSRLQSIVSLALDRTVFSTFYMCSHLSAAA